MSMTNLKESEFNRIWQELAKIRKPQEELIPKEQDRVQESSLGITLYRDSAGYVLYLQREGEWASGEQFRESFHLSSSCFGIGGEDGEIVITVKGVGHGLGISQFAAREMVFVLNDDMTWAHDESRHPIRLCYGLSRDAMFGDLFAKLGNAGK